MGLLYGCSVEDVVTGLKIQYRGWKSVCYLPQREAFLGVAPNTLEVALVQYMRWSQGLFQIFLSKYCPFIYGYGKIKFGAYIASLLNKTIEEVGVENVVQVVMDNAKSFQAAGP